MSFSIDWATALVTIIFGIAAGIGSAIGNYIALKYVIEHLDKIPSLKKQAIKRIRGGRK